MNRLPKVFAALVAACAFPLLLMPGHAAADDTQPPDASPPPLPAPPPPPPPVEQPPPLPVVQYFVGEGGKPVGPLTLEEVQARIKTNEITAATLVWKHGMAEWAAAQTLPELAGSFASATPATTPTQAPTPTQTEAPTPAQTQTPTQTADWTSFMLGTWEAMSYDAARGLNVDLKATFAADKTFRGTYMTSSPKTGRNIAIIFGTWSTAPVADKRFSLTMTISAQGSPRTETQTTNATVIDQNSIRDETDGTISRRIRN